MIIPMDVHHLKISEIGKGAITLNTWICSFLIIQYNTCLSIPDVWSANVCKMLQCLSHLSKILLTELKMVQASGNPRSPMAIQLSFFYFSVCIFFPGCYYWMSYFSYCLGKRLESPVVLSLGSECLRCFQPTDDILFSCKAKNILAICFF